MIVTGRMIRRPLYYNGIAVKPQLLWSTSFLHSDYGFSARGCQDSPIGQTLDPLLIP